MQRELKHFIRHKFIYHDVVTLGNYDGDTITFKTHIAGYDYGFGVLIHSPAEFGPFKVRLYGVDTYEMRGGTPETKKLALEAREFVTSKLEEYESRITIQTFKADSFGRYLAHVYFRDTEEERDLSKMDLLQYLLVKKGLTTGRYEDLLEGTQARNI